MAAMTALFGFAGTMLAGFDGLLIAILLAIIMNLFAWYNLDKLVVRMEPLQYETTTQFIGLSSACAGSHHPGGPKVRHALTFKLDHSGGAAHRITINHSLTLWVLIHPRSLTLGIPSAWSGY